MNNALGRSKRIQRQIVAGAHELSTRGVPCTGHEQVMADRFLEKYALVMDFSRSLAEMSRDCDCTVLGGCRGGLALSLILVVVKVLPCFDLRRAMSSKRSHPMKQERGRQLVFVEKPNVDNYIHRAGV